MRDKLFAVLVHVDVDDEDMLLYTLNGLTLEYNSFKTAIRTRSDQLFLEELHSLLRAEEQTIEASHASVLQDSQFSAMITTPHSSSSFQGREQGFQSFNRGNF